MPAPKNTIEERTFARKKNLKVTHEFLLTEDFFFLSRTVICVASSRNCTYVDKTERAVKDYSNSALLFSENICLKTNTTMGGGG